MKTVNCPADLNLLLNSDNCKVRRDEGTKKFPRLKSLNAHLNKYL